MIGFNGFSDPAFWQTAAIGMGIIIGLAALAAFPAWVAEVMRRGEK